MTTARLEVEGSLHVVLLFLATWIFEYEADFSISTCRFVGDNTSTWYQATNPLATLECNEIRGEQ